MNYEQRYQRQLKRFEDINLEDPTTWDVPDFLVSRHTGTLDWMRQTIPAWAEVPTRSAVNGAEIRGLVVAGVLSVHLTAECARYYAVSFDFRPPPQGTEYSVEDHINSGAYLTMYSVMRADYAAGFQLELAEKARIQGWRTKAPRGRLKVRL